MMDAGLFDDLGPPDLRDLFLAYHKENPHIYAAFCRFAQEAIARGRKFLGAKMLFERIRWYTQIEARDDTFKLNNNYHAFYARLWMSEHAEPPAFFRTRVQTYAKGTQ